MSCALEAVVSLLRAIRKVKMKEIRLVEREAHTRNPRCIGKELKPLVTLAKGGEVIHAQLSILIKNICKSYDLILA